MKQNKQIIRLAPGPGDMVGILAGLPRTRGADSIAEGGGNHDEN